MAGSKLSDRPIRIAQLLLLLVILAAGVVVIQKSLHFVATTPPMNVDDSEGNVSVSLVEHGRYGFLASPTQGFFEVDRTHAFFNYGPLYFYVGAVLTWLFGPSVVLFRILHPLGLCVAVIACVLTFRKISLVGAAVFAVSIYTIYLASHWPLGRPDIVVSVCAACMFWFASKAISESRWMAWIGVGFFAASAATTHLIASALIPAAFLIWLLSLFCSPEERVDRKRYLVLSFGGLAVGGLAGALVFLQAIDFRIGDLLGFGAGTAKVYAKPFSENLRTHFIYAWNLTPFRFHALVAAFGAATMLTAGAFLLPRPERRQVLAFVMPPVVSAVFYQLSLGFYGNYHSGYVILSQVTALWAVSALVSVSIAFVRERLGPWAKSFDLLALATAILVGVVFTANAARFQSLWESYALGNVDIDEYARQVVAPLPERAATWGSLYFGLDAGDRTDLVQFLQMFSIVSSDFHVEERSRLAPDFLLLSNYETDTGAVQIIDKQQNYFENFSKIFPSDAYRLFRIVCAPPYGCTRDYQRASSTDASNADATPSVSVNDGTSRQWNQQLSAPLEARFSKAELVLADLQIYAMHPKRRATESLVTELPAGFYLLNVGIPDARPNQSGVILATPGRYFYWYGGYTAFSVPGAPYWNGETSVQIVVDHLGGPLYVSHFENAPASGKQAVSAPTDRPKANQSAGMRVISVQRVMVLPDTTGRLQPVPLQPLAQWEKKDPNMSVEPEDEGIVRISGKAVSQAQLLQSPPIHLQDHQRFVLSMPTSPTVGAVEVGVLGSDGVWLAQPTTMPRRLVFETSAAKEAAVVILKSGLLKEEPRLDATISPGMMLPVLPHEQYVDRLMSHRQYGARKLISK
jgi:hypothetical protein